MSHTTSEILVINNRKVCGEMTAWEDELKPCPKCKGTDIRTNTLVGKTNKENEYYYSCSNCGYKTAAKSTIGLADLAWQNRERRVKL